MKKLFLLLATLALGLMVGCSYDDTELVGRLDDLEEEVNDLRDGGESSAEDNKIYYTTSDGKKLFPNTTEPAAFGAILVSNTYEDGQGVLTFDDTITSIGEKAFYNCSSLTSITIPDSVIEIGGSAFSGCTGELIINSKIVETDYSYGYPSSSGWLEGAKFSKLTIGNGVTSIGDSAFRGCSSLTSVTIPDSVTSIGGSAFSGCTSLTSVTIGNGVTSIGNSAFYECSSLTSVTIGNGVTSIGNSAFYECSSLTSITIPEDVTSIGDSAFRGCSSLTSVTIPDSVTSIGEEAFRGCLFTKETFINNSSLDAETNNYWGASIYDIIQEDGLCINGTIAVDCKPDATSVTIPDSVTSIGEKAFFYCSSLTSVTIGNDVTSIGESAFFYCSSLTSVTIGNGVTSIGESAFFHCSSLTSITIPDGVTSIGGAAFYYCTSLTSVYCKPTTPPSGDSGMFDYNASGRKIYVPTESVWAYIEADGWRNYADAIEPYVFE